MVEELTGSEVSETPAEERKSSPFAVIVPLGRVLVLPRSTFARLATDERAAWPAALTLVGVTALLEASLALGFAFRTGPIGRYFAAVAVRYGAALLTPLAFACAAAGVLVWAQRWWQGDAPYGRLLSAVSLALVPLALRDGVQAVYMAVERKVLLHPGLSALVQPVPRTLPGQALYAALGQVDVFMLWSLVLLTLAVAVTHGRGWVRPVLVALLLAFAGALLGALPSLGFLPLLVR